MLRAQPREAERAEREDVLADQAGVGEARQHQRVEPDEDAGGHAGERAARGAVAPDEAAEEGRRKLRHRGERQQPDRGKLRVAGRAVIHVGEHQDHEDRDPPHREQQRADVLAARQDRLAPLQHERHHDVVRRHDGERDGLDDHHRGRGRQSADEGDEREHFVAGRERQVEHEHVAVAAGRELQQPGDRDRDDEQVDQHEIERKQPGGAAHFGFASGSRPP